MARVDQAHYETAQRLIRAGTWIVDADRGRVLSARRRVVSESMRPGGYRRIRLRSGGGVVEHRVIWEYVNGAIPPDMFVNHIDGDKTNNRISNLELVTHLENVLHAARTGLSAHVKLDAAKAREIYRRAWDGEDARTLAAKFGVSRTRVSAIKHGQDWSHATGA